MKSIAKRLVKAGHPDIACELQNIVGGKELAPPEIVEEFDRLVSEFGTVAKQAGGLSQKLEKVKKPLGDLSNKAKRLNYKGDLGWLVIEDYAHAVASFVESVETLDRYSKWWAKSK